MPGRREARTLFVEVNSWVISLAITFGIAPLLFIQVILGRFFYTATILVGWAWFGMLVLLTVGYYLNYVAKFRLRAGKGAGAVVVAGGGAASSPSPRSRSRSTCCTSSPGGGSRWRTAPGRRWATPRSCRGSSTSSWRPWRWPGRSPRSWRCAARPGEATREALQGMARFGVKAALIATLLQLVDGFWLLLALPEDVLRGFMRGGAVTMAPLGVGIVAGVLLLVVLAQISDPLAQATKVRLAAELFVGAMVLMIVTRHELRDFYLARARAGEQVTVAPQWGSLALFLGGFRAVRRAHDLRARQGREGPPRARRGRRVATGQAPRLLEGPQARVEGSREDGAEEQRKDDWLVSVFLSSAPQPSAPPAA